MNYLSILAEATETASGFREDVEIVPVDFIWEQITALTWLQAVIAISFGVVYLLYGWRIFRILVVISFGLFGMFLGIFVGRQLGNEVWGGLVGLGLLAFVSVPLMKWAVCILGAIAGGILTGGLWYAFELPEMYIWAGLFAQSSLPAPIATRLREAMAQVMTSPDVLRAFETSGSLVAYQDAPAFSDFVAADSRRLIAAVRKIGKVE